MPSGGAVFGGKAREIANVLCHQCLAASKSRGEHIGVYAAGQAEFGDGGRLDAVRA